MELVPVTFFFLVYPLLTAAMFHLGARALITTFLWSRYPPKLDQLMSCAACSGTWYGLIVAAVGWWYGVPFLGVDHWVTIPIVGLASMVWTPIVADWHERALMNLTPPPEPVITEPAQGDGVLTCIDCARPYVSRAIGSPVDEKWGKRCTDCATRASGVSATTEVDVAHVDADPPAR